MDHIFMGSICIMLEDLGFESKERRDQLSPMSYHCYDHPILRYAKILADVSELIVLEMCLTSFEVHIDQWIKMPTGIFVVEEEICLNIFNPLSIDKANTFVNRSIKLANNELYPKNR